MRRTWHVHSSARRIAGGSLVAAAFALFGPGAAAHELAFNGGAGDDAFVSRSFDAAIDWRAAGLRFDGGLFQALSPSAAVTQYALGARWRPTDTASLRVRVKRVEEELLRILGGEVGASMDLSPWWGSSLATVVSVGASYHGYSADTDRRLAAAVIERYPDQSSASLRIAQDLPADWSVSLGTERFRYDSDPTALALLLAQRFSRPNQGPLRPVYTLIGFPERSVDAAVSWTGIEDLSIDVTASEIRTVVGQRLRGYGIGFTWTSGAVNVGLLLSRSTATEVLGPRGRVTLLPESSGTYVEMRIGVAF